jgi:dTDP-4-dehydrorhamnose 3,5-epimerase
MEFEPLGIEGAWRAVSPVWSDERGFFREWFKSEDMIARTGIDFSIQQANFSQSHMGVIRGIHYSLSPQGQAKWVTCVSGSIRDVIVDIRPDSPTFGKSVHIDITAHDGTAILIGPGLGHGFASLRDSSKFVYLLSTPYSPKVEFDINPFDPALSIDWGLDLTKVYLSEKDKNAPTLAQRLFDGNLP